MKGEGENEEKIYVSIQLDKEMYKEHIIQIQNFIVTSEADENNIILYIMEEFNEAIKYEKLYKMNHVSAPNIIFEMYFCDSAVDMAIYYNCSWKALAYRFCNADR